jgi:hypothetical protein
MPIEFSELFHKSELTNNGARFKVPGVYIWGFVYHKDGDKIGDPIHFTEQADNNVFPSLNPAEQVFIPYYVGESSSNVLSRLIEHVQPLKSPSSKRTRLTMDYMKKYFSDIHFPLHYRGGNGNSFINLINLYHPTRVVEYFNDEVVLNLIYGNGGILINGKTRDYPINNQFLMPGKIELNDTLDYYINKLNNFFFTYVDIYSLFDFVGQNRCFIGQYASAIIKKFEALTVIMLKGKTLGKFDDVGSVLSSINDCPNQLIFNSMTRSGFDIFKDSQNLLRDPTGDYNINNVDFRGYLLKNSFIA